MDEKIKVFTIDDSPIYRQVLREIINSDPELEYCGYASNGALAIEKLKHVQPDVITLDIEMPELDGIETLKYIMENDPVPTIMVSSFTKDGADITFKALELGAVDYIQKPESMDLKSNVEFLEDLLITKIKVFSHMKVIQNEKRESKKAEESLPAFGGLPSYTLPKVRTQPVDVVCIGSSTGGTVALTNIIPRLSRDIGVPILIVQHMPRLYTKGFADRLNSLSELEVKEAANGESLVPGVVYIAPGGYHLKVKNRKIIIDDSEQVNNHKPSVDVLFNAVEKEFGASALALILTGMGSDGAKGLASIKDSGGYTVAQDEESSVIFGMPGSAIKTGKVDRIIPLDKISQFICDFIRMKRD